MKFIYILLFIIFVVNGEKLTKSHASRANRRSHNKIHQMASEPPKVDIDMIGETNTHLLATMMNIDKDKTPYQQTCCYEGKQHWCGMIKNENHKTMCKNANGEFKKDKSLCPGSGKYRTKCCVTPYPIKETCDDIYCMHYRKIDDWETPDFRKVLKDETIIDCSEYGLDINDKLFNKYQTEGQYSSTIRDMSDIDMIVLHEGFPKPNKYISDDSWHEQKISTHFAIEQDGTVFQLRPIKQKGNHVGTKGVNARSIGIDFRPSGFKSPCSSCAKDLDTCFWSNKLIESTRKLFKCLKTTITGLTNIFDYAHVICHRECQKRSDVRGFPWDKFKDIVANVQMKTDDEGWLDTYGPNQIENYHTKMGPVTS